MTSKENIHANGKLLLSAEYLVLKGAKALALPLRFGQDLSISSSGQGLLKWNSHSPSGTWFSCIFRMPALNLLTTNDNAVAKRLREILLHAERIQPDCLDALDGKNVSIHANYPVEWGLGSSSTLITLVAKLCGCDPFELFFACSRGSGYDIACAISQTPIFYRLSEKGPEYQETSVSEILRNHSFFVYLGNKQDSSTEVNIFLGREEPDASLVTEVGQLSQAIAYATDLKSLIAAVEDHEKLLSGLLDRPRLSDLRFPGFPGAVKSLGAWGGDFAMLVSGLGKKELMPIVAGYGLGEVFTLDEITATP